MAEAMGQAMVHEEAMAAVDDGDETMEEEAMQPSPWREPSDETLPPSDVSCHASQDVGSAEMPPPPAPSALEGSVAPCAAPPNARPSAAPLMPPLAAAAPPSLMPPPAASLAASSSLAAPPSPVAPRVGPLAPQCFISTPLLSGSSEWAAGPSAATGQSTAAASGSPRTDWRPRPRVDGRADIDRTPNVPFSHVCRSCKMKTKHGVGRAACHNRNCPSHQRHAPAHGQPSSSSAAQSLFSGPSEWAARPSAAAGNSTTAASGTGSPRTLDWRPLPRVEVGADIDRVPNVPFTNMCHFCNKMTKTGRGKARCHNRNCPSYQGK